MGDNNTNLEGIAEVAAGEKSLKVALEPDQLAVLGGTIFIAMLLAMLLALLIVHKLAL